MFQVVQEGQWGDVFVRHHDIGYQQGVDGHRPLHRNAVDGRQVFRGFKANGQTDNSKEQEDVYLGDVDLTNFIGRAVFDAHWLEKSCTHLRIGRSL